MMGDITWQPFVAWWLIGLLGVGGVAWCVREAVRAGRQAHSARAGARWWRRGVAVVLATVVLAGPSTQHNDVETYTNGVEVYFVVDRTGSMAAEDYVDGSTRLAGVRADLAALADALPGARYSIIAFDSTAVRVLPLSSDARAVRTWADALDREITAYSTGSLIDRPLDALLTALRASQEKTPDATRLVFMFSDGENTAPGEPQSFASAASMVSGGAVLGYGTAEGGQMAVNDPTGRTSGWITDPTLPGDPPAVSHLDEATLQTVADQLGVPYVHRDGFGDLSALVSGVDLTKINTVASRTVTTTEYAVWPFAAALYVLLLWELVAVVVRWRTPVGVVPPRIPQPRTPQPGDPQPAVPQPRAPQPPDRQEGSE